MNPVATIAALPPLPEMRRAFSMSDPSYDGIFFTAVQTTGIFCKPSCRARKPKAEHARFYASAREAIFAGYRPCRRCKPLDINGRTPDWVQKLLAIVDEHPTEWIKDAEIRARGIRRYGCEESRE